MQSAIYGLRPGSIWFNACGSIDLHTTVRILVLFVSALKLYQSAVYHVAVSI